MKYKVNIYTENHVIEHIMEHYSFCDFMRAFNQRKTILTDEHLAIRFDEVIALQIVDEYDD